MLSERAQAVIGPTHPVVFAAPHLGYGSVAEFIEEMGKAANEKPEVIQSYVKAIESGVPTGERIIPHFTVKPIEQLCAQLTSPADSVSNDNAKTPIHRPKHKRKKNKGRHLRVSRRH